MVLWSSQHEELHERVAALGRLRNGDVESTRAPMVGTECASSPPLGQLQLFPEGLF